MTDTLSFLSDQVQKDATRIRNSALVAERKGPNGTPRKAIMMCPASVLAKSTTRELAKWGKRVPK